MVYTTEYATPVGPIPLTCDGEAIIGLWFNGQRYFGNILPEQTEKKEHPLFADAKRWLDVYFSGREPDFLPPLRYDWVCTICFSDMPRAADIMRWKCCIIGSLFL